MSQRSEKYARSMEWRVGALEERMDKTETNATQTGTRLGILEDDLAVYKAAMACKQARQNREAVAERVQAHRLQRELERRERVADHAHAVTVRGEPVEHGHRFGIDHASLEPERVEERVRAGRN